MHPHHAVAAKYRQLRRMMLLPMAYSAGAFALLHCTLPAAPLDSLEFGGVHSHWPMSSHPCAEEHYAQRVKSHCVKLSFCHFIYLKLNKMFRVLEDREAKTKSKSLLVFKDLSKKVQTIMYFFSWMARGIPCLIQVAVL